MDNVHVIDLPPASADPAEALEPGGADTVECEGPDFIASLRRTSSGLIENAAHTTINDDWKPTRGFMNGVFLAVPLWGLIGFVLWFVLAW